MSQARWDKFLFKEALEAMPEWGPIVEIGAIRDIRPVAARSDGHSTVKWAESGRDVICIDIEARAIATAKSLVGERSNVNFICADAFEYLEKMDYREKGPFGLLYLDGPHPSKEDGVQFALDCFKVCENHMAVGSIVLIDDCDVSPGKGDLVIPYALKHGYAMHMEGLRQTILKKVA